jgi:hypothetical protein
MIITKRRLMTEGLIHPREYLFQFSDNAFVSGVKSATAGTSASTTRIQASPRLDRIVKSNEWSTYSTWCDCTRYCRLLG